MNTIQLYALREAMLKMDDINMEYLEEVNMSFDAITVTVDGEHAGSVYLDTDDISAANVKWHYVYNPQAQE